MKTGNIKIIKIFILKSEALLKKNIGYQSCQKRDNLGTMITNLNRTKKGKKDWKDLKFEI